MISSKITIELYPAEGRQWAFVTLEGQDDPHLILAEGVKALATEISRLYAHGASEGIPLDLGALDVMGQPQELSPVSVGDLLSISDTIPHQDMVTDDAQLSPVQAGPDEREQK